MQLGRTTASEAVAVSTAALAEEADSPLKVALKVIKVSRRALLQAQAAYEAIKADSPDTTEQNEAATKLIEIRRELEFLEARRDGLVNGEARLRPPAASMINAAEDRARKLAEVISQNAKVAAIAGLAADIVRLTESLVA